MRSNPNRGRIYRRSGCRNEQGQQLGPHCPKLAAGKHGTWAFAVDLPSITGRRRTMRRSGFDTKTQAQTELNHILACERTGIVIDDRQTLVDYLTDSLATKALTLNRPPSPTTPTTSPKTSSPPSAASDSKNPATSTSHSSSARSSTPAAAR
ncbi:Arm DNA-binding domain-containing protein [Saccharopolyspora erythraea]|uniref:Arm DNA-binding domain-containing protein n=1 Tax=Saccharopolyspora erythraea TaxID=1836 RepID=UPI001BA56144|nr:Arm DNA-binding domain-containing protein [Saccharopolyspora erythraea]QUH04181.1 Arm DNA-binding domain-containing protein [Saccharopolyspora erythraea]